MAAPLMPRLRVIVFGFIILAAIVLLGLCAHMSSSAGGLPIPFISLGITASVLTLASVPLMLIMDNQRKGAFTSKIIVEISWLGFLWVMFLSAAATTSQTNADLGLAGFCSRKSEIEEQIDILEDPSVRSACNELRAVQAFAHLAWITLFGYIVTLTVFSIILANRGYGRVWHQSVRDTEFNAPPVNMGLPTQQYMPPQPSAYPPQATPAPASV